MSKEQIDSEEILFIALGGSPTGWYRCGLPANYLGCDWIGMSKGPPGIGHYLAGNVEKENANAHKYRLIIVQQPHGIEWEKTILEWQKSGIKVLFECDDYLHGVRRIKSHPFKKAYDRKSLKSYERCMRICDGMIISTEFLANKYKKYNKNIFVCPIGIETVRYDIKFPSRNHVSLGWAGGAAHEAAFANWAQQISYLLNSYKNTSFVSVGVDYAILFEKFFPNRTLSVPWVSIENFPYTLTHFDINLAPAHDSHYYLSKSELRFIQASALGIPSIVDPRIYKSATHKRNAMVAPAPEDFTTHAGSLIRNENLRKELGENARFFAKENFDVSVTSQEWIKAIEGIW